LFYCLLNFFTLEERHLQVFATPTLVAQKMKRGKEKSRWRSLLSFFGEIWGAFAAVDYKIPRTCWMSFWNIQRLTEVWRSEEMTHVMSPTRLATSLIFLFFFVLHFADFELLQIKVDTPFVFAGSDFVIDANLNGLIELQCLQGLECGSVGRLHVVLMGKHFMIPELSLPIPAFEDKVGSIEPEVFLFWNELVRDLSRNPDHVNDAMNAKILPILVASAVALSLACLIFSGGSMRDAAHSYAFAVYLHAAFLQLMLALLVLRILAGEQYGGIIPVFLATSAFLVYGFINLWRTCDGNFSVRIMRLTAVSATYLLLVGSMFTAWQLLP
jgi:hypothetical protein